MNTSTQSKETPVSIKNNKGLNLAGVLHLPLGTKKYPAVIHFHGFTGYKEEPNNVELARELVKQGFVVLRFDASGDGESEGTLSDDYRISNYLKDIDSVYEFIKNHPRVDKNRIGLWGHSMGAMLVIIWGSKHSEVKAICSVSPPIQMGTTDWLAQFMGQWKEHGWFIKQSKSGRGEKRIPWEFAEDAKKYNVLDVVGNVRIPLMLILGLAEDTVPPEHTREIYRKANEPKELIEVEGMSHDYKNFPDQIQYVNSKVIAFFSKYLM